MRPDIFLATIGRGSNGSNALEVTEDRAAVTAESQDNIINRVNNVSQYGPSWHYVPGIGVAGTAYAEVPGTALGDLAFSRASSKTRTNAAGVIQTIGNNVPPHDYRNADGTLSTFPRLNLEPQRTNSIRNSTMVGAVAGTPGTSPTNWSTATSGLTQTIVGVGTENGLPYIDFRFAGTSSGVVVTIQQEGVLTVAASVGQVWSSSIYSKVISAPNAPLSYNIRLREGASGGSFVADGLQTFVPTSSLQRFVYTRTNTGATTAFLQPSIVININSGASYDFTIRIAAPQMELGAYATTFIRTTTAAVTRVADAASKTGVASLIGQTEGTLFLEFAVPLNESVTRSIVLSSSTVANRVAISTFAGSVFARVDVGGVNQVNSNATVTVTNMNKVAFRYKENDFAVYVNGVKVITDTSGITFSAGTLDRFAFIQADSTSAFNGIVSQMAVFTTGLTDAQLAELTTL
jgi:hypothetical protein